VAAHRSAHGDHPTPARSSACRSVTRNRQLDFVFSRGMGGVGVSSPTGEPHCNPFLSITAAFLFHDQPHRAPCFLPSRLLPRPSMWSRWRPSGCDRPPFSPVRNRRHALARTSTASDKVPVFPPPARSAPGPRPPGPRRHRPARGDSSHGLVPPQRPARPRRMPPGARLALPTATDPVGLGFGRASCRLQPVSRTLSVRPPPPRGARRHCWNQTHLSVLALSRRTPSP